MISSTFIHVSKQVCVLVMPRQYEQLIQNSCDLQAEVEELLPVFKTKWSSQMTAQKNKLDCEKLI